MGLPRIEHYSYPNNLSGNSIIPRKSTLLEFDSKQHLLKQCTILQVLQKRVCPFQRKYTFLKKI